MAIGKHLLGRIPSPPDSRDFKAENFEFDQPVQPMPVGAVGFMAAVPVDPIAEIDAGIAELKKTTTTFKRWAATTYPDVTLTHWWKALNHFKRAKDALTPPPPPPGPNDPVIWDNSEPTLDQEDTGHCVGFDAAQFGNTLPYNDQWNNAVGHAIYYECKIIDGDPGAENGSWIRSGAKALQNRGRIGSYAWCSTVQQVKDWVRVKGPVMVGTTWHNDMFDPDASGLVKPTGGIAGGHAYLLMGDLPSEQAFMFLNSWGASWGDNGRFKIKYSDFATLMADYGEVCVALELAL